ncbi:MAG: bifunctional glutathionylspermidine amidase/synthase [Nisaea sp.]|uniref:bifunctional glutathionylspermidine amidase/synthase n=1 Tax=Nisaea sp. TaxID=2024842 RepID=UPI001B29F7CD|nr:bifunctional glutathionylspermidine amidase/synthase [Nisaea sp.]MBO6561165.1 bifunctional glutathionylspermidine amidase/synthase [Nisaea sp.]
MHNKHLPESERFGAVIGIAPGGVAAYSSDYETVDNAELPTRQHYRSVVDGIYLGHKWQCVEFARRWLYRNKGYVFEDIAMAYDIFQLREVKVIEDGSRLPLRSFRNGSVRAPEIGGLMIWKEGGFFDVTGHVAVITEVLPDRVRVAEQNVDHKVWPAGQDWARELPMRVDAEGGHWVDCTYDDGEVLGWVLQTEDATGAEAHREVPPEVFRPVMREVRQSGGPEVSWLDTSDPAEAAYIEMMGGCKLATDEADGRKYICISETAHNEIRRATNELHRMFLHATNLVLNDEKLLRKFNLPPAIWPRIQKSWSNRRNEMITGRFDFSLSEHGLKVYEYNADSASCHMETGVVQGRWAEHFGCTDGWCPGEDLLENLKEAWEEAEVGDILHIMQDRDLEETYHALFIQKSMDAAGIKSKIIKGTSGLTWDDEGWVCDAEGVRIKWVWKSWAWETALDQIRHDLEDDAEDLELHRTIDRKTQKPRLVDVLLREEVMVFEPLWTLIPSNKAILPVLSSMYPENRYLLESSFELTENIAKKGYVVKPIVGRCGHNIAIYDRNDNLVSATEGNFDEQDQIYQELFPLPKLDGKYVQIGTFSVGGSYGGACVRVDPSPILTTNSDILPLRVVPDDAL